MSRAKMQKRLKRKKFIRNIVIGLSSLAIIAFILNTAPGYMRDRFKNQTNLVINARNVTERLVNEIYVNDAGAIFLSMEDVYNLFDKTIYYDSESNEIITTSDTKVAAISFERYEMVINNVVRRISSKAMEKDGVMYVPISDMGIVYNINVEYFDLDGIVAIEDLSVEMTIATVAENTALRRRPRRLSRKVVGLEQGQRVKCFNREREGWRQVRTEEGQVRFYSSK